MESKVNIIKALNELMKEIEFVPLEKNPNLKYMIVSYDGLLEKIRDKAIAHGLVMIPSDCQHTNCTPYERAGYENKMVHMKCDSYVFTFTIWHTSGEYLIVKAPGVGVDEQDKGPGKALTYATKSAWLKALMLKSGDDPDQEPSQQHSRHNTASNYPQQRPQPPQQQRPSNAAQQPNKGTLTDDPETWPPEWQRALAATLEKAKDVSVINLMDDFNIMDVLKKAEDMVVARNPPEIIRKTFMHLVAGWTFHTAMQSEKANQVAVDVNKNWATFENYIGKGSEKAKNINKKLAEHIPF